MPIPFDDLAERDSGGTVAWLRFVDEEEGHGVRAALFETSNLGEPLRFSFARADKNTQAQLNTDKAPWREDAVLSLTRSLLRSAAGSPALLLGLADEIPLWVVTDALRVGLPFCCVSVENRSSPQLLWANEPPREGTEAHQTVEKIMQRADPFEAFARAANCLSKAFEYRRIRGVSNFAGLNAVLNLDRPEVENGRSYSGPAKSLWALLEVRPVDERHDQGPLRSSWVSQMEWPGELMPFQISGVQALLEMNRLLLADDMGLGKTVQTVAAVRILRAQGRD